MPLTELFLEKLTAQTRLNDLELDAIRSLAGRTEQIAAGTPLTGGADNPCTTTLVIAGVCARFGMPNESRRHITSVFMSGEMTDLGCALQPTEAFVVESLTTATIVRFRHGCLQDLMRDFPGIAEAFARNVVCESYIAQEWLTNIGGRDAKAGMAHLFCEVAIRQSRNRSNRFSFHFGITQVQLGEILGLSAVHVNRTLGSLRQLGLVHVDKGEVYVHDWERLKDVGEFDGIYLDYGVPRRIAAEAAISVN